MRRRKENPDYEKITIYPGDYDGETVNTLYETLKKLGVRFQYEHY